MRTSIDGSRRKTPDEVRSLVLEILLEHGRLILERRAQEAATRERKTGEEPSAAIINSNDEPNHDPKL